LLVAVELLTSKALAVQAGFAQLLQLRVVGVH
jgi:hypothetical protein